VRHLPVVGEGPVVGVLSASDLLRYAARSGWREASQEPVRRAMTRPAETIDPEAEIADAAARMVEHGIGCLPVVSDGRTLVGILTRADLLAHEARGGMQAVPTGGDAGVRSVMNPDPATAAEDDDLLEAAARMRRTGARHLPVIDGERRVVAMLSDQDLRAATGAASTRDDAAEPIRVQAVKVVHAMSTPAVTVPDTASLALVARYFMDHRVGALPVVDTDDRLVGLVSYVDLLSAAYKPMG
jgi:CBS-domain-containing membrane protein